MKGFKPQVLGMKKHSKERFNPMKMGVKMLLHKTKREAPAQMESTPESSMEMDEEKNVPNTLSLFQAETIKVDPKMQQVALKLKAAVDTGLESFKKFFEEFQISFTSSCEQIKLFFVEVEGNFKKFLGSFNSTTMNRPNWNKTKREAPSQMESTPDSSMEMNKENNVNTLSLFQAETIKVNPQMQQVVLKLKDAVDTGLVSFKKFFEEFQISFTASFEQFKLFFAEMEGNFKKFLGSFQNNSTTMNWSNWNKKNSTMNNNNNNEVPAL